MDRVYRMKQHQLLMTMFNLLFEDRLIFQSLFQSLEKHINELKENLEGGDPNHYFYSQR
jgi:hypothetical protein